MEDYTSILNLEKIVKDLWDYLQNSPVKIIAYNDINDTQEEVLVEREDQITILNVQINITHPSVNFFPYKVRIGIGDIIVKEDIIEAKKCIADLIYEKDFMLSTMDFYNRKLERILD